MSIFRLLIMPAFEFSGTFFINLISPLVKFCCCGINAVTNFFFIIQECPYSSLNNNKILNSKKLIIKNIK